MTCIVRYLLDPTKHLILLATVLGLIAFPGALAAEPSSLGVEVKFFLKPSQVLDTNYRPKDALRKAFEVAKEKKKKAVMIRMQFLDSPKQELHQERLEYPLS